MRHLIIVIFVLSLMVGFAFAQGNVSNVDQKNVAPLLDGKNEAIVTQIGGSNTADVIQEVAQFFNIADVYQIGYGNISDIKQINEYTHGSATSLFTAKQEQRGNDNSAVIYQQGFRWGTNNADQYQEGDDNRATINQLAVAATSAKQTQIGYDNDAWIQQGLDLNKTSSINYCYAEINQDGSENYSRIDQIRGNKLRAYNDQYDYGNKSEISQSGIYEPIGVTAIGNTATVTQYGSAAGNGYVNVSSVYQNGDNNTATVTQTWQ